MFDTEISLPAVYAFQVTKNVIDALPGLGVFQVGPIPKPPTILYTSSKISLHHACEVCGASSDADVRVRIAAEEVIANTG